MANRHIKKKLKGKKAWASTPTAKAMQILFICMSCKKTACWWTREVSNTSEIKRNTARLEEAIAALMVKKQTLPVLQ